MLNAKVLQLSEAEKAANAVIKEASKGGDPIAVAVVDAWGTPIVVIKMDGALPLMVRMALNKAYTAATYKGDTSLWGTRFKESGRDVTWYDDRRLTVIPGGVCIKLADETIIGAVGVSGRFAPEDEALSIVGVKALKGVL
jgi:glc operon protein GlcG